MRVTSQLMANSYKSSLFRQNEGLYRLHEQIANEKKINRPSDDPVGMGKVLDYRTALSSIEQYQRNVSRAKSLVETSDTVLDAVDKLLIEARDVAADYSTGESEEEALETATTKIDAIREQLFSLANSKLNGRYIFAGRDSDTEPFVDDGSGTISYVGDASANSDTTFIISEGVKVSLAANGDEIFNGSEDVFALLSDLSAELQAADPDEDLIGDIQARLQGVIDQERGIRAENAVIYDRLESTETQLDSLELNFENLLDDEQGLNLAEAALKFQALETVYKATLSSAASIIQTSLVDFL
jgi:flagellar hook-associated protein 3 FlgL